VVNGLVRCVHPGIDGHVSFGTVLAVGYDALLKQSYIDVEDLEGRVLNAIKEYGCDLTTLGNYGNSAPAPSAATPTTPTAACASRSAGSTTARTWSTSNST